VAVLSIKETAGRLRVTEHTVRNWEAGRARVPYSALELLQTWFCYHLPGDSWKGWRLRGDALYSPEGLAFHSHDAAWWSLTCAMAREFRKIMSSSSSRELGKGQVSTELAQSILRDPDAFFSGDRAVVVGGTVTPGHSRARPFDLATVSLQASRRVLPAHVVLRRRHSAARGGPRGVGAGQARKRLGGVSRFGVASANRLSRMRFRRGIGLSTWSPALCRKLVTPAQSLLGETSIVAATAA
jgi:transcriptional regulator with XRE-family HTH domain